MKGYVMKFCSNIIDKIKAILETESEEKVYIFDKDVAEALNMTQSNLSMMKKRDTLPLQEIVEFCAKRKVNINWVLYGQIPDSLNEQTDRLIEIKYLGEIKSGAGGGAFNDNDEYSNVSYPDYILASLGYKKHLKNIEIISVSGDSMEPELFNADKIFIDRNKVAPNEKDIFIVNSPDGIFVKRLKFINNETLELVSSNKIYKNISLPVEDLGIIGKVIIKLEEQ